MADEVNCVLVEPKLAEETAEDTQQEGEQTILSTLMVKSIKWMT